MTTNQVIDVLVSQRETEKPLTLPVLLSRHASEMIDLNEFLVKTTRSCIWNKARVLYKRAIVTTPLVLKRELMVEFCGGEGADAGVLKLKKFCSMLTRSGLKEAKRGGYRDATGDWSVSWKWLEQLLPTPFYWEDLASHVCTQLHFTSWYLTTYL